MDLEGYVDLLINQRQHLSQSVHHNIVKAKLWQKERQNKRVLYRDFFHIGNQVVFYIKKNANTKANVELAILDPISYHFKA